MRISIGALRNTLGLLFGFGFGLILTSSTTVSALSMIPGLSLLAPTNNSNVSGTITFVAAADGEGLTSLQFKIDGADYGAPITSGSCRATFDTRSTNDGPHTIQAVGTDEYGNTVFTSPSTVFVNNTAPAISGVGVSNITTSSVTITWTTAVAADGRVDYGVTTGYGQSAYVSNMATSHSVTLTGLSAGTTYQFSALSFGSNGILSQSGNFTFTTSGVSPTPTPTPNPTPIVPTPTPTPGGPTPTPTPTPVFPTPTPTPIFPTPVPTPTPGPSPSPTPTSTPTGSYGRQAPTGSTSTGSAIPRDSNWVEPTPTPTVIGTASIRGAGTSSMGTNGTGSSSAIVRGGGSTSLVLPVNPGGSGTSSTTGASTGAGTTGFTAAMFMPGGSVRMQVPTPPTPTVQPQAPPKNSGKQSERAEPTYTPCAGPNPFINEGGGACVNGTWIRIEPTGTATSGSTTGSTAPQTSVEPVQGTTATPAEAPKDPAKALAEAMGGAKGKAAPTTTKGGCTTPDPYAARGGVGLCVNGEWLQLVKPKRGGK